MMHTALQARTSQQMTVTPQLQQAIGLLQLSSQELETRLRATFGQNVFLDIDEEEDVVTLEEAEDELADDWVGPSATPVSGSLPESEQAAPQADLKAHLRWQVGMSSLSARDGLIAELIIDALDDDGYLAGTVADHLDTLAELKVEADEFEAVRQYVMHLDPAGCGAQSLAECLRVQIDGLAVPPELADCARSLAGCELEWLAAASPTKIAEFCQCDEHLAERALVLIRGLEPRPGSRLSGQAADAIVPDVLVTRRRGRWVVELNAQVVPRVQLNSLYAAMLNESGEGRQCEGLQKQLQEARWLVKSVQMRNETLLKVAAAIMQHQSGFLERGELAMKPMVLREIAEVVGMHESTVSRVTTRKYIQTPRGNFELKYFFSSRLATRAGTSCSATAVRALIRRLIDEENPAAPLSDGRIGKLLAERGVRIARRTVAKYREALRIPPLAERQVSARHSLAART
jgi:RNA polymerase sigma-54 factor